MTSLPRSKSFKAIWKICEEQTEIRPSFTKILASIKALFDTFMWEVAMSNSILNFFNLSIDLVHKTGLRHWFTNQTHMILKVPVAYPLEVKIISEQQHTFLSERLSFSFRRLGSHVDLCYFWCFWILLWSFKAIVWKIKTIKNLKNFSFSVPQ